jgi:hypothetical protein
LVTPLVALAILARTAGAEPPRPVALEWTRADGADACVDAATLERRVEERLGWDAVRAGAPRSIVGRVERRRDGYVAKLELEEAGARGMSRTLESEETDCTALDDAVVLALALAIDPSAALAAPTSASRARFPDFEQKAPAATQPTAATSPEAQPAQPRAPTSKLSDRRSPRLSATLRGLGVAGLLPNPAWGLGVNVERSLSARWSVEFGLRWLPAVPADDDRLLFGFSGGSLGACRTLASPLQLCAGLLGGGVSATVRTGGAGDAGEHPFIGLELAPRVSAVARGFRWELGVALALPLLQPHFMSNDHVLGDHPAALTGFLGVGPEIP